MVFELSFTTADGSVIRIGALDERARGVLETTARIHEIPPPEELPERSESCRVILFSERNGLPPGVPAKPVLTISGLEIYRSGNLFYYGLSELPPPTWEESFRYRLPLLNAMMAATLEDGKSILFHGCLLLNDAGEGIVLTGESEVGKSTTFRRWIAAGGTGLCDDLMILTVLPSAGGGCRFCAQPLPTWSRCLREGVPAEVLRYPLGKAVNVRHILWLTRSATDREEILPVPVQKWHGQLLAACNQHLLFSQYALSVEERRNLVMAYWKIVDEIDRIYRPLALAAHLKGDLRETWKQLESYGRKE